MRTDETRETLNYFPSVGRLLLLVALLFLREPRVRPWAWLS